MIRTPPLLAVLAVAGHLLVPVAGHGQQVPEWLLRLKLPNSAAKSIMTPSAWGAAFGSAYIGVGGADRSPYLPSTDAVVGLGYGMGDPVLGIGLQIGTTISDLSEFDNVSVSFKLHQYLARGTAFAFGGESLFSNNALADDAGNTFYLVVSHVLQALGSRRQGVGSVHVSAGACSPPPSGPRASDPPRRPVSASLRTPAPRPRHPPRRLSRGRSTRTFRSDR